MMIGGVQCTTKLLEDVRNHLSNVVLIVNMNYGFVAHRASGIIRELYGRFFLDIVFIGPRDIPELGVSGE